MASSQSNSEMVSCSARALLSEILSQISEVAAPAEVRDLAEALSLLAPLALGGSRPTAAA